MGEEAQSLSSSTCSMALRSTPLPFRFLVDPLRFVFGVPLLELEDRKLPIRRHIFLKLRDSQKEKKTKKERKKAKGSGSGRESREANEWEEDVMEKRKDSSFLVFDFRSFFSFFFWS